MADAATVVGASIAAGYLIKDVFDAERKISFKIINNTAKPLTLVGTHMDCGQQNAPAYIGPKKEGEGTVASKYGMYGVKGALIYRWGDSDKEKVVLYLENPVNGCNKHGIKYYWETYESAHWYYCNIGTHGSGDEMKRVTNDWFHHSSFVTGGNKATAAYVLRGE